MSDIFVNAPHGWRVSGMLRDTEYPELLNSTMVSLFHGPTNTLIHAGWQPEEDVGGQYVIGVVQNCEAVGGIQRTRDAQEAKQILLALAAALTPAEPIHVVSNGRVFRVSVQLEARSGSVRTYRSPERCYA